jgi:hypothetical protein
MATIIAIELFVISVLASALSRQLVDEFKAWLPWITQFFIEHAIARLPASYSQRYREEWQSHVNEIPGEVGKLIAAISLLWAARRISACLSRGLDINTSHKEKRAWIGRSSAIKICALALASLVVYIVLPQTSRVRHLSGTIPSPRLVMSVSVRVFPPRR